MSLQLSFPYEPLECGRRLRWRHRELGLDRFRRHSAPSPPQKSDNGLAIRGRPRGRRSPASSVPRWRTTRSGQLSLLVGGLSLGLVFLRAAQLLQSLPEKSNFLLQGATLRFDGLSHHRNTSERRHQRRLRCVDFIRLSSSIQAEEQASRRGHRQIACVLSSKLILRRPRPRTLQRRGGTFVLRSYYLV
jgi:hypothetical protein